MIYGIISVFYCTEDIFKFSLILPMIVLSPQRCRTYIPQLKSSLSLSPFDQLHGDEVVPVSAVEDDEAVRRRGLELEEEVHCGIRLQRGQAQVAALGLEGHGVGDDEAHAEARVQLAEVDVAVLAHVDVLHAVELEALWGETLRDDGVVNKLWTTRSVDYFVYLS